MSFGSGISRLGVLYYMETMVTGTSVSNAQGREAFLGWYDTVADAVYAYLLTLLHDPADAEDVLQQVFLELLRRYGTQAEPVSRGYLYQAARHRAIQLQQRRRQERDRQRKFSMLLTLRASGKAATETLNANEDAVLLPLLATLPAEQMEAIVLRVYAEFSLQEIAEITGAPLKTVSSRYQTGLSTLREHYQRKLQHGE